MPSEYVRTSELPPEADSRPQPPSQRSFVEKLGLYNTGLLVIGTVASFLAMAFLALLWSGSETAKNDRPTPVIWYTIAAKPNWATRVATIGSVVIRLATAAQMGVFAALVAAWTLETKGASAEHLPLLSIIRTVNNGPQSHVWNVFHSLRIGSRKFYSAIVIVAILNTLALQFTSTLLVSDFGSVTVVPHAGQQAVSYGILSQYDNEEGSQNGRIQPTMGVDLNLHTPSTYPRFAEFVNPNSTHLGEDYADTGSTYRAFLPLSVSDARGALREYEGPATVVDSRVRCTRPSMSINNITFLRGSGSNEPYEIVVSGNIALDGSIPGLTVNATDETSGLFMTSAVARIYANTSDWRLSYSMVDVGDVEGPTNPINPATAGTSNLMGFLLLNITGNWTDVLETTDTMTLAVGPYDWTQRPSGLWTDLKTTNETLDIGMSGTVCFLDLESNDLWIRANSTHDFPEPTGMSWLVGLWRYETGVVRKMLGATKEHLPLNERGILNLQKPANWTEDIMPRIGDQFIQPSIFNSLRRLEHADIMVYYPNFNSEGFFPQTAVLTPFSQYNSINHALSSVFQDIIQTTRNPALAFQALFTTMSQTAYYQALPLFNLEALATVSTSDTFTVPRHWTGFGIVMGLLITHAVLVVTAVVLFLSGTDHSLLGNAWQAVAQVASSDTRDTINHASNMTDLEVKRLLRMNSCGDDEVVLRTGADGARSQAVYRRATGGSY
ncbi:hypothetical protein N0V86_000893 [Didymella sp. IMI 355093]|nr:hypothetical protein N0V86_000893 [Didymella sp. IMI 355093]